MSRPDAALALSAIYVFENKREARVGSVCVAGAGLETAIFCDIVARFYTGAARNGNETLAVGLAAVTPLPPDSAMVKTAVNRKNEIGELQYPRSVRKVSDTSLAEAVLRNGVIFNAESVMVLSAPATWLAKAMDLSGAKEMFRQRVKRLVIVDAGMPQQDAAAMRKVLSECPAPMFFCGPDVGTSLMFPGASLDQAYSWAPAHPVVDAYRAFKAMPHDTPLHDLAAVHFAVHPDSGFFAVSDTGSVTVGNDGSMKFAPGAGNIRRLTLEPAKKDAALEALVATASAASLRK